METSKIVILIVLNVILMLGWTIALTQKQLKEGKKLIKKGWMKILVRERKLTPKERSIRIQKMQERIGLILIAGVLLGTMFIVDYIKDIIKKNKNKKRKSYI